MELAKVLSINHFRGKAFTIHLVMILINLLLKEIFPKFIKHLIKQITLVLIKEIEKKFRKGEDVTSKTTDYIHIFKKNQEKTVFFT